MILNATSGAGAPMMYYFSDSYVTGIKEDEPNTFLNGTKFKELEPIFYQLNLDVLTREDGPFPVGSEKRRKVCEQNDIVLELSLIHI